MSKLELTKLTREELEEFLRLRSKYAKHDKVDLLIHKTLKSMGVQKEDFLNRKIRKTKKEQAVSNPPPNEVMFCTNDTCEFDV